ncbi:DUF1534 domain-containing protein [Pseudomonas savastanoi pv. phaseolicola]|nr:DUF1534 domain-containing protein [Pseudomonas savastanoi]MBN3468368.1 DUF1534 domain-containing protein [Pseudomonas savastanoi pv. phaseolicola]PYD22184.1 hypothetical protein DND36_15335 [Pseudomonas savastanoi pv. glycinea]QDW00314.1 DUF1534 domain-containing protein [Pseudomonas sp. KBS0707]TSC34881.1 DUF1534 domain-containing protein [Pseudomonas sp. ST1]
MSHEFVVLFKERYALKIGRRASRTACPRGAWAR